MDAYLQTLGSSLPPSARWLAHPRLWLIVFWLVAGSTLLQRFLHARHEFANHASYTADQMRPTGGRGHLQIDFGGQWLMGRMVTLGHGRDLYNRNVQWSVVRNGFPRDAEPPYLRDHVFPASRFPGKGPDDQTDHDAESLMDWMMGKPNDSPRWEDVGRGIAVVIVGDNPLSLLAAIPVADSLVTPEVVQAVNQKSVGGPLYPPILGLWYAPLGWIDHPEFAYAVWQSVLLILIVVAARGLAVLSDGRIWWPVAISMLALWPGCRAGLDLAQNPTISVAILAWGWAMLHRKRDITAGIILGLFAFKPVWALSFLLAPLCLGRWKAVAAMILTGLLQILLTLPIVGIDTWFDWLSIGREASALYQVNRNWIELSRDVGGLVRRPFLDFSIPESQRAHALADRIAGAVQIGIVLMTLIISTVLVREKKTTGLAAGFLLLGCYLSCYRFMYYDSLLAAVAFAALVAGIDWRKATSAVQPFWFLRSLPGLALIMLLVCENVIWSLGLKGTIALDSTKPTAAGSTPFDPAIHWEIGFRFAWDTVIYLVVWLWMGVRLIWQRVFPAGSTAPTQ